MPEGLNRKALNKQLIETYMVVSLNEKHSIIDVNVLRHHWLIQPSPFPFLGFKENSHHFFCASKSPLSITNSLQIYRTTVCCTVHTPHLADAILRVKLHPKVAPHPQKNLGNKFIVKCTYLDSMYSLFYAVGGGGNILEVPSFFRCYITWLQPPSPSVHHSCHPLRLSSLCVDFPQAQVTG